VATNVDTVEGAGKRMGGIEDVADILRRHDKFLIVSHIRPDGDCLGSATALLAGLRQMGKTVASYNASGVMEKLRFIPLWQDIRTELPPWTPEVTIFVDCGGVGRVSPTFRPFGYTINIDHHATNESFGDLNWIDIEACAVGEQIYDLLSHMGLELTADMATSLYSSICADTGSFRFPNTNARTFDIAADLTRRGASPAEICRWLYESRGRGEILIAARAFSRMQYECAGRMVWTESFWSSCSEAGGIDSEPEGLATEMRAVDGVEVSILFHQVEQGGLRVGFRGKGAVDCAELARLCGGGGHRNASGYYNEGADYLKVRERVLGLERIAVAKAFPA